MLFYEFHRDKLSLNLPFKKRDALGLLNSCFFKAAVSFDADIR